MLHPVALFILICPLVLFKKLLENSHGLRLFMCFFQLLLEGDCIPFNRDHYSFVTVLIFPTALFFSQIRKNYHCQNISQILRSDKILGNEISGGLFSY